MLQATNQAGSTTHPWKRQVATFDSAYDQYKYIDANSDNYFMDLIYPLLVQLGERLHASQRIISQVDTIYHDHN
jgi:hypothetical protein